jgi:4-carboxymuconolactone decarboxylase
MDGSLIEMRSGCDAAAIAARDAEINGKPQRIEPSAPAGVSPDLKDVVVQLHASLGLDSPAELDVYFRTMAKHPEMFRCQMQMGTVLFTGRLPARDRELAVLRVAWLLRAPYEWGEHVEIAKRCDVRPEEIERVIEGSTARGWSAHEQAILGAVEQLLSSQSISDETWTTLAARWDEPQLIEFPMMVGQYVSTALVQNALRVRLSPSNPGLTHR